MTTIFQMNATEMDGRFVEAVKSLFSNTTITISIESTPDLTDTLNNNLPTHQQLTKAMNESRQGKVMAVEFDDLIEKIEQGIDFNTFVASYQ
jgi:hypothetical protein